MALATLRKIVQDVDARHQQDPDLHEETLWFPTRDGVKLSLMVFGPKRDAGETESSTSSHPLILLYFPGAFIGGSPATMAVLARMLVKRFDAVVVLPQYRLAPEHPFPAGVNDGWDALLWVTKNTDRLNADSAKGFIVGGISSGGSITNVVAHLGRDEKIEPAITGLWLSCSSVRIAPDEAHHLPQAYKERNLSRSEAGNSDNPISSSLMSKAAKEFIRPDVNSKLYAPMIWSPGEPDLGHKGLPKTYSQVCGMDGPRDEALIFDDMLKKSGTETKLDLYVGLPHTFWAQFRELPQSKKWVEETMDGFQWLLEP
jgi:acetyl esterase/lipase